MSDGYYKPNQNRKTRRRKKNPTKGLSCQIVTYPALTFSSKWIGDDFYSWVNKEWISDTTIPPFEADFGASEEIEECIEEEIKSVIHDILERQTPTKEEVLVQNIHTSFYHSRAESLVFVKEHIEVYGADNHMRLTGKHETASIHDFSYGVSDRGASIRIPIAVVEKGWKGWLEDRRPNSAADPYKVAARIIKTVKTAKL
jgi:hypothetical protein